MNFRQIQLLEYSFYCLQEILERKLPEEKMPNYKLVIQSSNDIFVADSLQFDQCGKPYFSMPRDTESFFYDKKPIAYSHLENNHPFLKVRHNIYEKFEISMVLRIQ